MRLRLGDAGEGAVAFGRSPAHEALRSLHVLVDIRHHPLHISWALEARARMPAALKAEVDAFAFWYLDRPLDLRRIWAFADLRSWEEELEALRAAPVEGFVEEMVHAALAGRGTGPLVPLERLRRSQTLQEQALARVEARHPPSAPVLRELTADPSRCRDRFVAFLSSYWDACIAPEWPALEALLMDDLARRGRAVSRHGLAATLEELSPHVRPADDGVTIHRPGRGSGSAPLDVVLSERDQVLLVPSHFVWPELTALLQRERRPGGESQTVLIVYAASHMQREGKPPVAPEKVLKLLRAAGDVTRLRILQLLAARPRSTHELAGLIALTDAAVSKHLKLLQDAGWIEPRRQSYYVYYHLVRESMTELSDSLAELLS